MTRISLNARQQLDGPSADPEVVLFHFSHPSWDQAVRISTDNADLISTDPLVYGTRSAWRADPATEPYLWAATSVEMPGDQRAGMQARLAFEGNIPALITALRSSHDLTAAHIAVVLASAPDLPCREFVDLVVTSASFSEQEGLLWLTVGRENEEQERMPWVVMDRARAPGLYL